MRQSIIIPGHASGLARSLATSAAASALLAGPNAPAYPRAVQAFRPRADVNDPATILAALQKTFEAFKASNDERVGALEKGRGDVLSAEQVARINKDLGDLQTAMDEMNVRLAAANLNGGKDPADDPFNSSTAERRAYSKAFRAAFRKGGVGDIDATLKDLAIKAAMQTQSDPDGGWMVPVEMDQQISRVLQNVSAVRNLAQVQPISSSEYKKLVSQGGAVSGWVGEQDARAQTGTPQLAEIAVTAQELYANPFATQQLLDDAFVDIGEWLANEVAITFAEQEGLAFVTGNGVKKPHGILAYPTIADANYAWGKLGFIGTGGTGFEADPAGLDTLITAMYALKAGYRINATWMANRRTIGDIRTMKDSQGRYQWQPSQIAGEPPTLLGYPIVDDDNMPDVASGAFPVAFGDFKRGYLIVDRIGTRVLRDPYSNKPFVSFYTTKRVGGGVQNFEAIKLIKCA